MSLQPGAGLLFDIDGTLVESDPLHLEAFNRAFAPYGHQFDRERFGRELQGLANEAIGSRFLPQETPERQWEIMMDKEALFRDLASEGVEAVHGLFALLDWADGMGLPTVAVTNAPRPNAEMLLDSIGARGRFKGLVIGDELAHGKPHPLPYLTGMELLGAKPEHCVAFEDSRTGIRSATAAGIATVGIATGLEPNQLLEAGATLGVRDYADPDLLDFILEKVTL
ncbi:phosphoglycolate phosphatase [Devosia crocina]|uniref:Phosphoglycolate phosphatase n=1 Tax=Devosia crocina TaxID=429728 RepID=A0A1I7NNM6_9HYPH|nr:HAD-IA family hydrolase [Devosia crocina]SFV36264.1 phosphoglycolate phosphatase [Devosia crocina]